MNRVDRERKERHYRERGDQIYEQLGTLVVGDRGRSYLALATEMHACFAAAAYYHSLKDEVR
jgi:hypothetical protein